MAKLVLAMAAMLLLGACHRHRRVHEVTVVRTTTVPAEVVVERDPPPPQAETRPVAPSADYVWVTGYWVWERDWIWMPGVYVVRPRPAAVWVPGHWDRRPRGWVWIGGHWR